MLLVSLYWMTLVLCCFRVAWAGGTAERVCVSAVTIASILTVLVISPLPERYRHLEWQVMLVDVGLLAALISIVIVSKRY